MNDVRVVELLCRSWTSQSRVTVLDADFGQGLLFLKLWDAWRHNSKRPQRLHVIGLLPRLPDQVTLRDAVAAQLKEIGGEQLLPHLEAMQQAWPLLCLVLALTLTPTLRRFYHKMTMHGRNGHAGMNAVDMRLYAGADT